MINSIKNAFGERLDHTYAPGQEPQKKSGWLVLLGHGVTGNKDRPIIVDVAKALNTAGFDTLRFSFAGNGESEGDFKDATITKESEDLAAVLDSVSSMYPHIVYIGHSMGSAVGVLQASKDSRINALISLAGMVDTKTFAATEFGEEEPDHGQMWDDPDCPLSTAFMEDLCGQIGSVAAQAESVSVPWLLIHGTADDVVRPEDTAQIKNLKGDRVTAVSIDGADHSFSEPEHTAKAARTVVDWLGQIV